MIRDKVILYDTLWNLSKNRPSITEWVKVKPYCVVEIIKTASNNLKNVVLMDVLKVNTYQYLLAVSAIGTLANIMSTPFGLRFIMRLLPTLNFFDLLIWTSLYLNTPEANALKREILQCLHYAMANPKALRHFSNNHNFYKLLAMTLQQEPSHELLDITISIIQTLVFDPPNDYLPYYAIERLPVVELRHLAEHGNSYFKQRAISVLQRISQLYLKTHNSQSEFDSKFSFNLDQIKNPHKKTRAELLYEMIEPFFEIKSKKSDESVGSYKRRTSLEKEIIKINQEKMEKTKGDQDSSSLSFSSRSESLSSKDHSVKSMKSMKSMKSVKSVKGEVKGKSKTKVVIANPKTNKNKIDKKKSKDKT